MLCSLCHAQFRSFVAFSSLPISNRPVQRCCQLPISHLSIITPVAYSLLNSAIQTIYILAYFKPCELMPNHVNYGQQMLGLRLLSICVYIALYTSYMHFYLVKRRPHLHPERENCMLKSTKMLSASGELCPPDHLTRGFASGPHWGHIPRSPL